MRFEEPHLKMPQHESGFINISGVLLLDMNKYTQHVDSQRGTN